MMRLLSQLFKKTRTLRVSIITLFLSLTIIAFSAVITFTYAKDYKQIVITTKQVAEKLNDVILEKFSDIAQGSERITEVTAGFFFDLGPISIENKELMSYMLNIVKYDPYYSNFYIGLDDGSFFGALNLSASAQTTFIGEPTKLLPPEVAFAVRFVNCAVDPASDSWYYLNDKFETLAVETLPSVIFNSLTRPWYKGAVEKQGLYWTGFYLFYPTTERGITVANPVFDKNQNIVAVVGADLTFVQMSNFLSHQVIGKTGKAFLVNNNGEVLIPDQSHLEEAPISANLVNQVIEWYNKNPQRPDFIFKSNDVEYFAFVSKVSVIFGQDWKIVIIAPLKEFFSQMLKMQRTVILMIIGILILCSLIIAYFAQRISAPIVILANEVNKVRQLELGSETRVMSNVKEIFLMDNAIAAMRRALRSFARYVPKDVVKDLFQKGEDIHLGGEKKEITIFFSDVAGFTTIAEALPIDVLTPLLTEYFDVMTKIIQDSHGTVDKFIGDGIMAFWGAPLDIPDHASRACTTALRCNAMMTRFNQKRKEEGKPEFRTRFGINTGTVIVGNIGTSDRMNYTVIGDAVNLTARLQEVDKYYHTSIIVSEDTYKKIKDEFLVRPLDIVNVKGKKEKVKIYELIAKLKCDDAAIQASQAQIELCIAFTEAYETYMRKELDKAKGLFTAILQKFPEDYPTQLFLKKIEEELSSKKSQ